MPTPALAEMPVDSQEARRRVLADLKRLRRDASVLLNLLASDTSEVAAGTRERVSEFIERLREVSQTVKAEARESARAADEEVKSHPYRFVAVSFGVGVLVGAIVNR